MQYLIHCHWKSILLRSSQALWGKGLYKHTSLNPYFSTSLLSHTIFTLSDSSAMLSLSFWAVPIISVTLIFSFFSHKGSQSKRLPFSLMCWSFQQPDESSGKWKAHNRDLEHLVWYTLWFQSGWIDKKKLSALSDLIMCLSFMKRIFLRIGLIPAVQCGVNEQESITWVDE